ncbi:MAG TPA: hypothetical protein VHB73_04095 [Alphaproteobacteria bacterium]|nr:hypothetical protein [Alphaproteobacteria bacterium]
MTAHERVAMAKDLQQKAEEWRGWVSEKFDAASRTMLGEQNAGAAALAPAFVSGQPGLRPVGKFSFGVDKDRGLARSTTLPSLRSRLRGLFRPDPLRPELGWWPGKYSDDDLDGPG